MRLRIKSTVCALGPAENPSRWWARAERAAVRLQIIAFVESERLRPTDRTFANLQRVRQFMCDWEAWNASLSRIAALISGIRIPPPNRNRALFQPLQWTKYHLPTSTPQVRQTNPASPAKEPYTTRKEPC